ncbi:NAD-dependent DNA ligase LigA [Blattabacterium cuenoti]|uniref:NAD-dependent DNA ligase LigA n=1 Tax=Blattabacterium cuenoti TaxID=1653831 RepID=UPI00163C92EF|nr:NAD-dependent DNA ligase LigA [Blattabacterium cuenoti]
MKEKKKGKKIDRKSKNKIYKLRKKLSEYNLKYYNLHRSDISDFSFDKKMKELYDLEKTYPYLYDSTSPTLNVGVKTNGKNYYKYKYKMYSINNCYSKKELKIWEKKIRKSIANFSFICEIKYDGVSINLIYKKGILSNAITRGDGETGEDIIDKIRTIKSIPQKLKGKNYPFYMEIRGEIFIPIKDFIEINKNRVKNGNNPYSNPRNTASGIIQIRDKEIIKNINLYFVAFNAVRLEHSQYESLKKMKYWGFKTPEFSRLCKNLQEVFNYIDFCTIKKNKLPYKIDGIVIKVNEYRQKFILGYTEKFPRWAIAYKFKQKLSESKLSNITFQVGRTGIITPIANIKPIIISGTIVKKVSLYNDTFIQKKGIYHGDTIFLEKGGDIIPKLTKINTKKRLINSIPISFLKNCPSCYSILTKKNALFYCTNNNCYSKRIMRLKHFSSDKAMNIKNIGEKMIEKLYFHGFLYDFPDFFNLSKENFLQIDKVKEKLANNIIRSIEISKKSTYNKVLHALGIRYVGEYISNILEKNFLNIHYLIHASYDQLISILGIGEKIAKSIINYFSIKQNRTVIKELIKIGLKFSQSKVKKENNPIKGNYFVFTGKLSCMTRNKAKSIIESLGGVVLNTVNNKINFIIVGKNYGSKLEKSMNKNNIKILTEDLFIKMLKKK